MPTEDSEIMVLRGSLSPTTKEPGRRPSPCEVERYQVGLAQNFGVSGFVNLLGLTESVDDIAEV